MSSVLPMYYQIKQTIRNWILTDEFKPGEKIPTEKALSETFKVNRLTVRKAISQLIQEDFLKSFRGVGTFVTDNAEIRRRANFEFAGLLDELFYQVSKSQTKSVEIDLITAPIFVKEKLELDGDEAIRIKRIRYKDGRPFAYTVNYLSLEIGKKFTKQMLYEKPLLQIMEQDLGIIFTEATQTIEAKFGVEEICSYLNIESGSPILFVERIMYTTKGKPIEFVQSSYRGDEYKFFMRFKSVRKKDDREWVTQIK